MKVLIFGSRNLNWHHLPLMYSLAEHSLLYSPTDLGDWLAAASALRPEYCVAEAEPLVLINGDGPPGKATKSNRSPIGADRLAVLACMHRWPAVRSDGSRRRSVRYFNVEPREGEQADTAAGRRDVEMACANPDKVYCVHTDLDSSKGSRITASALKSRRIPFWYVRVTAGGEVVKVERRA